MTRWLDLYLLPSVDAAKREADKFDDKQVRLWRITYWAAQALQWRYDDKRKALVVKGCGMDMHFHTVYSLSCVLFCSKHYDHNKAYYLKHKTI